jgi:hypothetical protein
VLQNKHVAMWESFPASLTTYRPVSKPPARVVPLDHHEDETWLMGGYPSAGVYATGIQTLLTSGASHAATLGHGSKQLDVDLVLLP